MKVRNVTGQVVVVPLDGGIAVAVGGVVDVSDGDAARLVESGQFEAVRITSSGARGAGASRDARATSKPRKKT